MVLCPCCHSSRSCMQDVSRYHHYSSLRVPYLHLTRLFTCRYLPIPTNLCITFTLYCNVTDTVIHCIWKRNYRNVYSYNQGCSRKFLFAGTLLLPFSFPSLLPLLSFPPSSNVLLLNLVCSVRYNLHSRYCTDTLQSA